MSPTCTPCGGITEHSKIEVEPKAPNSPLGMVSLDQLLLSQRQTAQLGLENERLTSQLQEVIGMNARWQKYDEQREAYILRLHEANKELLRKLSSLQKMCSELQQQQNSRPTQTLQAERPNASGVREAAKTVPTSGASSPLCALDAKFARKEKELATLTDTLELLQEENASLRRTATKRQKDEEERIALYKEQLDVFMEDFRKERSDRETMHSGRLRLRKQLDEAEATITRLREEINDLIEEACWLRDRPSRLTHHYSDQAAAPSRTARHVNYYTTGPSRPTQYVRQVVAPGARGAGYDVPDYDSVSDLPSDVTVDGEGGAESLEASLSAVALSPSPDHHLPLDEGGEAPASSPLSSAGAGRDWECRSPVFGVEKTELPLRCPECLVKFAVEEHSELLKHIELCSGAIPDEY